MTFAFSEVQQELRATAARFLDEKFTSEAVRALMETDAGFDEATWKQVAELGWCGMAIPEEFGGAGFGALELTVLLEEMGKRLACLPFFSSAILGTTAILEAAGDDQKAELLPSLADGTTRATLAWVAPDGRWEPEAPGVTANANGTLSGETRYVIDGTTATLLVVAAKSEGSVNLYAVDPDASGVTRERMTTLDMTRRQGRIVFENAPATRLGDGSDATAALRNTLDRAAAALAAEMVGGAQWCLDASASYARERHQFGRPIGSFQAVKHQCADMLIEIENARSAAYYAGWAAAEDPAELPVAATLAKAYCSDAFFDAASRTIQIHGGIGFTWEHDAHLYFRRAKSSEIYLGDAAYHREQLVTRLGV